MKCPFGLGRDKIAFQQHLVEYPTIIGNPTGPSLQLHLSAIRQMHRKLTNPAIIERRLFDLLIQTIYAKHPDQLTGVARHRQA